ncbi:MAG TPA: MFS transporter [Caulobacteraceae bacterium]|nr:MFS transporter [Caulobacteraceae bacterium]
MVEAESEDGAAPPAGDEPPLPHPRRLSATLFILITIVLDSAALGVIFPALPGLVRTLHVKAATSTAEIIGLLTIAFAGMQFLASPMQGALSDRFGRRPIVLASNFALGVNYLIMALAPTFGWLFLGRLISGAAAGSVSAAYAYVADISTPRQRAASFGFLQAAQGLGWAIGPAIGGFLADYMGVRAPFWAAAALSLANTVFGLVILPESLSKDRRAPLTLRHLNPFAAVYGLLRGYPQLIGILTPSFLMNVIFTGMVSIAAVYTTYRYGWTGLHIGVYMLVLASGFMAGTAALPALIVGRIGERLTAVGGMLLQTAALLVAGLASTSAGYWWAVPLMSMGAVANPAWSAIASHSVSAQEQGRLNGAATSLASIAGVVGPGLFAEVYAHSAGASGKTFTAGAPFFMAAGLALVAALIAAAATRNHRRLTA